MVHRSLLWLILSYPLAMGQIRGIPGETNDHRELSRYRKGKQGGTPRRALKSKKDKTGSKGKTGKGGKKEKDDKKEETKEPDNSYKTLDTNTKEEKPSTPPPTKNPTARPTNSPTPRPTENPTARPTNSPTPRPTKNPTARPTNSPTPRPTRDPTARPTNWPAPLPTGAPTYSPTSSPTPLPTNKPTARPKKTKYKPQDTGGEKTDPGNENGEGGGTEKSAKTKLCKRDKTFRTTLLIEHDGEKMDEEADSKELLELGKQFLELYNEMNKPDEAPQNCDSKYRRVEAVEVQAMGNFERVLDDNTYDDRSIHLYHVTASCEGDCDSRTSLFDNEEGKGVSGRRELSGKGEPLATFFADVTEAIEFCECNEMKENRAPTVGEFVNKFNNTVSSLYYSLDEKTKVKTNANEATALFELEEVQCERSGEEDSFETTVYVDYQGDGLRKLDKINSKLKAHLMRSFRYSYNELANLFCDPLQRQVVQVEITEENINRRLADKKKVVDKKKKRRRRRRLKYKIRGTCKGCPRKTRIFDDIKKATRFLQRATEDIAGLSGLEQLDPAVRRLQKKRIKTKAKDDKCYCSRHPETARAPSSEEFTFWYDQSKQLAKGVEVVRVVEIPS